MIVFVFLAVLCSAATKLLQRIILKNADPYAYSLVTQLISVLLFFILALPHLSFPTELKAWLSLGIAGFLWSLVSFSSYTAQKKTDVSLMEPLSQSKLLWVLLFGMLILGEVVVFQRVLGTGIIFMGVCLLLYHPEKKWEKLSDAGVKWTLSAALLDALVAIADKATLQWFHPTVYGFLVYLIPLIIFIPFYPARKGHVSYLLTNHWLGTLFAIVLSTASYYFTLQAYALADVTFVYPLLRLGTLITVFGGIFFLGERDHFWQKILASGVIILGSVLVGK